MRKRVAGWMARMTIWPRHRHREYIAVERHNRTRTTGYFPAVYPARETKERGLGNDRTERTEHG